MNHNKHIRHILALECGAWKKTFFLDQNIHSLGRNSTNSLFCYHRVISRNHASLIKLDYLNLAAQNESKNVFWLIDGDLRGKRSTNGIYVNGKKCLSHLLKPGDTIFFGGIDIKAKYDIIDVETQSFYSKLSTEVQKKIYLDSLKKKQEDSLSIQLDSSQLNSFELISNTILIVDSNTKTIVNANSNASSLLGYSLAEIQQLKITDIDKIEENIITNELDSLQNYNISCLRESVYQKKNQELVDVLVKSMTVEYDAKECLLLEIQNISPLKKIENILRYQNNHDLLTNFGNEELFKKQLSYCLGYKKIQETQLAIIKIRFDYAKKDIKTNEITNKKQIEKRIIGKVKKLFSIMDSVAKISQNEYYIMLEEFKSKAKIELIIEEILNYIKQPIVLENESFLLTANMGISIHPQDGQEVDELLQKSSLALEASYEKSLNNYHYYDGNILEEKNKKYQKEKTLYEIIQSKNISIKYKPIIDVTNEKILEFTTELFASEHLSEINSPLDFIKVTRTIGTTLDVIKLCLEKIASDVNLWKEKNIVLNKISFPILLSSLLDVHLFNSLSVLLKDFEDKIPNLEWDVIVDDDLFIHKNKLQSLSNLTKTSRNLTLSNFDLNQCINILNNSDFFHNIKISLPSDVDLENESKQRALIASFLTFSKALELNLIVDNVSTEKQKEILLEMGCKIMAGSCLNSSLSAESVVDFYHNHFG